MSAEDPKLHSVIRPPLFLTHPELPVRLRPRHLDGTSLGGIDAQTYEDLADPVFVFADRLLRLILPINERSIEAALNHYDARARASEALSRALTQCEPGWGGVIAATSVECWALGVDVKLDDQTESQWNPETLRDAARMLRSKKRPRGLGIDAAHVSNLASSLELIARDTERLDVYIRPRYSPNSSVSGRPKDIPALLFERLEGPLGDTSKAERARLAAKLLADFGVLVVTAESILAAEKTARRREGKARRQKQSD